MLGVVEYFVVVESAVVSSISNRWHNGVAYRKAVVGAILLPNSEPFQRIFEILKTIHFMMIVEGL